MDTLDDYDAKTYLDLPAIDCPPSVWKGALPTAPRYLFAAGDTKYFEAFAPSLAMAAHMQGVPLHLHVINPTDNAFGTADFILRRLPDVSIAWHHEPDLEQRGYRPIQLASYYCNLRMVLLPHLLRLGADRVYVTDLDIILNRHLPMQGPPNPIGLFLRDRWDMLGRSDARKGMLNCLGALWWVDYARLDYANQCADYILSHAPRWLLDQEALYQTMMAMGLRDEVFEINRTRIVDWKFDEASVIWTAKGPRKVRAEPFAQRTDALIAELRATKPQMQAPRSGLQVVDRLNGLQVAVEAEREAAKSMRPPQTA